MNIRKEAENGVLTVYLEGKLDTSTAPIAEKEIEADVAAAQKLILDLTEISYISSAGLRLTLKLHKQMAKRNGMTIRNVNESVSEVFEITGFSNILNIE